MAAQPPQAEVQPQSDQSENQVALNGEVQSEEEQGKQGVLSFLSISSL